MKKILIVIAIVLGLALNAYNDYKPSLQEAFSERTENSEKVLQAAFANRQSDLQVKGTGFVYRILPDDLNGSRHQRFLIHTASGQSILIAHNIDLADKIHSLKKNDTIEFYGEYEWNPKGGIIHWTHHDPEGRHVNGWLKHRGITYQ